MNIAVRARGTNAFHIDIDVIKRLRKLHKALPDISQELLDRELNRALIKMMARIESEYNGQESSLQIS